MSKIAYLECPTGIAGDMCLGALTDLGVPLDYLTQNLDCLSIAGEYKLWTEPVQRNGQRAIKLHVELSDADHHSAPERDSFAAANQPHDDPSHSKRRHLPEIEHMIRGAQLPARVESWSLAIFRQLAEAEGAVHGIAPEQVHFHEVGAIDAIVDVVGTCLGLDWLNIETLYCSAMPTGGGTIRAAHGRLPVPVPAVLKLWEMRQAPIYSNGIDRELVTPTGAAIATTLATDFGAPPKMTLQKVGLGAGSLNLPIPNILRLWIGESASLPEAQTPFPPSSLLPPPSSLPAIALLETQIDDLNPQAIGFLFDVLFEAGAVDVFTQAIGMKKSRPGILLTVLCPPERVHACEAVLFRETSTLGIRHSTQQRSLLDRAFQLVETEYGQVRIKVASKAGAIINVQPEYEDCAAIARQHQIAWREVHRLALQNWYLQHPQPWTNASLHSH